MVPNLREVAFFSFLVINLRAENLNLRQWSGTDISRAVRAQQLAMSGDLKTTVPKEGTPWPQPQKMTLNQQETLILTESNFDFSSTYECDILEKATTRYKELIFRDMGRTAPSIYQSQFFSRLFVVIKEPCEKYPHPNMDERYKLTVFKNGTGFLEARAVWGALRGLETFSQLIFSPDSKHIVIGTAEIEDFPRFTHRGILLDTARHFLKIRVLLENLDIMSQNKMNVFHWHIVDDQSFPYESKVFPLLSRKGAYTPKHVYTHDDIQTVVEYARLRGIRVIPEFDTPGHALSWGAGYGDLLTPCYTLNGLDGTFGPMDPTRNETYDFLTNLFGEVLRLFPDGYIHLGGDEVPFECWASNPKILKFMEKMKFQQDFSLLEQYFIQTLMASMRKMKKRINYVFWQEVFDNGAQLDSNTVIQVWKGIGKQYEYENELRQVTARNLKAILSSCWYLNYISYGMDWPKYYACDPHSFNGTPNQKALVIGGEACMWGEFVDSENLIQTLWPRASAVSERLWSDANVVDVVSATSRIEGHRCLLKRRGHQVGPISGPSFCQSDYSI